MVDLLSQAARLADTPAALATVIATKGSTPRHAGAKMLVRVDGTAVNTIGGGRIELEVMEAAVKVARGESPPTRLVKHLVRELAMCCGGEMELWIEPLDAARWKAMTEAARRRAKREPCVLVTQLSDPGGKDVLPADGSHAPSILADRYYEPVLPPPRLVLFGGGHVAAALAPLARRIGFEVVVCDEDERFASAERFPEVTLVHSFDLGEVTRDVVAFGRGDYAVILTRDHAVDQALLEKLLPRNELAYLGLIGSRGKLGRFRKRLEQKGIGDQAAWQRLHSPVGLDISAETPEEIAVAIVAQLIQTRNTQRGAG